MEVPPDQWRATAIGIVRTVLSVAALWQSKTRT
jgi:hypothetical protein